LTVTGNGNMLQGQWANISKKDPESGSFSAIRLSSITESISANVDDTGSDSGEGDKKTETEVPATTTAPEGSTAIPSATAATVMPDNSTMADMLSASMFQTIM
jgi:hypothetical protein